MLLSWDDYCAYDGSDPLDISEKDRIERLIESATATCERYCNRFFEIQERTVELLWQKNICLKALPVLTVQVFVDRAGLFGPETVLSSGFWLNKESGIVCFSAFPCPDVPVKVVYSGGFAVVPEDLKEAIYKTVKWDRARIFTNQVGIRSTIAGEITTNFDTALPYEVRQTLDLYKL